MKTGRSFTIFEPERKYDPSWEVTKSQHQHCKKQMEAAERRAHIWTDPFFMLLFVALLSDSHLLFELM